MSATNVRASTLVFGAIGFAALFLSAFTYGYGYLAVCVPNSLHEHDGSSSSTVSFPGRRYTTLHMSTDVRPLDAIPFFSSFSPVCLISSRSAMRTRLSLPLPSSGIALRRF